MENNTTFNRLNEVDITEYTRAKNGYKYLPWSTAWSLVLEQFPDATYGINKSEDGCIYHTDGVTCWVETWVTINGKTLDEMLPILNHANKAIAKDAVTTLNASNSIKRCLVKNLALFGLGLSLWTGEELSDRAKVAKAKKSAEIEELKTQITDTCKALIESKVTDKDHLYNIIALYNNGNSNPKSIKSVEVCELIINKLEEFEEDKD